LPTFGRSDDEMKRHTNADWLDQLNDNAQLLRSKQISSFQ